MGKAGAARKLAAAAAYGGGGLSLLGGALYGVLNVEAKLARRTIGEVREDPPPDPTGWYGRGRPGPAFRLALLGDSSAAGYGVERVEETPGALLASGISEHADRRVYLRDYAVVGARTPHLSTQIDRALPIEPDVAVILIGVNDVTHRTLPAESVRHLSEGVRRLREAGVEVVVGTCPDLGTVQPIAPPLKQVARAWSRRLAAAQTIAVIKEGGRTVSLGSILGPEFDAAPALLFGPDQFHPSVQGYCALSNLLIPSVLAALGLAPDDEAQPEPFRGEGVLPVTRAAVAPSRRPAPSSTAPRWAAIGSGCAGCGWSCGTGVAGPRPRARRPRRPRERPSRSLRGTSRFRSEGRSSKPATEERGRAWRVETSDDPELLVVGRDDHRRAGDRVRHDHARQAEDLLDQRRGDHLDRRTLRDDVPVGHRHDVVGVPAGQVEVVQHHDDGASGTPVQVAQQAQQLDLVVDVEERRGLVEQQQVGLLGQRHRDPYPLALTARELLHRPVHEVGGLGGVERRGDRRLVGGRPLPEPPLVGVPTPGRPGRPP